MRGMSCKNSRFIKSGLTKEEATKVDAQMASVKLLWERLLSLNRWTPQEPPRTGRRTPEAERQKPRRSQGRGT